MSAPAAPAVPDRRSSTTVALTVIAGTVMIPVDVTIVAIALARLSQETGASLPVVQWVATGYTLALATAIPAAAWAIGRYGGRRVLLAALTVFTLGSVLAAASWNVESLVAFRVLQGLGGGFVMPAAMSLALRATEPSDRGRVMALLGLPILVGPVAGPVLGGWLLDTLSWRWMFLINLPIGVLAVALGLRNLPRVPGDVTSRLDRRGLLLLPPAMALLVLGASASEGASVRGAAVLPMLVGAALVVGFVVHALRSAAPLLRVRLLARRLTGGGAAVMFLFAGGYFATLVLVPLYWQVARGDSATTAGLLMVPQAIVSGIAIQVSGRLVDRVPTARVVVPGITLAVLGYGTFAAQLAADAPYPWLLASLMVAGAGAGSTMMPTITLATRHLADDEIPSGSTMLNVGNQLATALTTAAVSALLAAALTARLPALAGGGIGALHELPEAERVAASPAVSDAVQAAFVLPVGMMAGALLLAVLLLREPAGRRDAGPAR